MFFYRNPLKWVKNLEISASSAWDPEQIRFGYSISADPNAELLGISIYPPSGERENVPNEFYLFSQQEDGQYVQQQVLRPSGLSIAESHNFGTDYNGPCVIYGASKNIIAVKGVGFEDRGAVAIFRSGSAGYVQEQVLIDEDENTESYSAFGYQVAMSGDSSLLLVSNIGNDTEGSNAGKIYLYRDVNGSFQKVQELPRPPGADLLFGRDQCVFTEDMNTLFVGYIYYSTDGGTTRPGAVYVYESGSSGYQLVETITDVESGFKHFGEALSYNEQTKDLAINNISDDWSARKVKIFQSGSNGYQLSQTLGDATVSYQKAQFSYDGAKLFLNKSDNTVSVFVDSGSGYAEIEQISIPAAYQFFQERTVNENGSRVIIADYSDDTLATNAGAVYVYESGSNGWAQSQKILPEDDWDPAEDHFGKGLTVSKNEDYIYILQGNQSSTGPSVNASDSVGGSLYVYKKADNGYEQVQRIVSPAMSLHPAATFGASASPDGTRIFGSDYLKDYDQDFETFGYNGVIYVYESGSSGYELAQEIQPPSPSLYGFFGVTGYNVSGTKLFAYDGNTNICYLYESGSSGYQVVQEITASDSTPQWDSFGGHVVLSEDETIALIAAGTDENSDNSGPGQGSLYIFQSGSSGYTQVQELPNIAPVTHPSGWHTAYGNNLILSEDNQEIIVSADTQRYEATNTYFQRTGTVIIFNSGSNGYHEVQRIEAPSSDEGDSFYFGRSVSLSGSYLAISAPNGGRTGYDDRGEVFIYEKINGVYEQKYTFKQEEGRNTEVTKNGFGQSIALLSNNELLVSSPWDDKNGADSGVVYRYKLTRDY